jgi:hypothetical protein
VLRENRFGIGIDWMTAQPLSVRWKPESIRTRAACPDAAIRRVTALDLHSDWTEAALPDESGTKVPHSKDRCAISRE